MRGRRVRRRARLAALLFFFGMAGAAAAAPPQSMPTGRAQRASESPIRAHTVELSGFAGWTTGSALAGQSALLTRDMAGTPPPDLPLFTVAIAQKAAPSFGGRLAYNLTRVFAIEGAFTYSRPSLTATISGDPAATVEPFTLARVNEMYGDGSLVVHLSRLVFADGRAIPFLAAGGGYLRQVFAGSRESVNGQVYNVGAGLKFFARPGGRTGIRLDVREYVRHPGPDETARVRTNISVAGSVLFVF